MSWNNINIRRKLPELGQSVFSSIGIAEFENPLENSLAFVCCLAELLGHLYRVHFKHQDDLCNRTVKCKKIQ